MKKKIILFLGLAIPYLAMIAIPNISMLMMINIIESTYVDNAVREKQRNVEESLAGIQQKTEAIENTAYSIAVNSFVKEYATLKPQTIPNSYFLKMRSLLSGYVLSPEIVNITFFDGDNDKIITPLVLYSNPVNYFTAAYKYLDMSPEEGFERIKNIPSGNRYMPSTGVLYEGNKFNVIEYVISVPIIYQNAEDRLIVAVDADRLIGNFDEIICNNGEFYLYKNGNVVYNNSDKYKEITESVESRNLIKTSCNGEDFYVIKTGVSGNGWSAKVVIPSDYIQMNITHKKVIPVIMILLTNFLSLILCVFFTRKNEKNISEFISLLKIDNEKIKYVNYGIVREHIEKIISENDQYKEKLNDEEQLKKHNIINNVINNVYSDSAELSADMNDIGLNWNYSSYAVVNIHYGSDYKMVLCDGITVREFVKKLLEYAVKIEFELHDISAKSVIIILKFNVTSGLDDVISEIVESIKAEIVFRYGIDIGVTAGGAVFDLMNLHESYEQSIEVQRYNETFTKKVSTYYEIADGEELYYYPVKFDERIINCILTGRADEAKKIISKVYNENFDSANLSVIAANAIRERIINNLRFLGKRCGLSKEIIDEIYDLDNIDVFFNRIYKLIDEICIEKKDSRNEVPLKIMNYVKENYSDQTISLKKISLVFGLSKNYISAVFKEAYNSNLSNVIEELRIKKACEFIKNTNMKMHEIAECVGYANDTSFRRAFKRVTGVAPSDYKGI